MAEENINLNNENQDLDYYILQLCEKFESLKNERDIKKSTKLPVRLEIRTLEFWKSVICECFASFLYVFIVCGAAAGPGTNTTLSSVILSTAIAAGFTMTTLTQCLGNISGKDTIFLLYKIFII